MRLRLGISALAGIVAALLGYGLTTAHEPFDVVSFGPGVTVIDQPGFNPWTGLPHGYRFTIDDGTTAHTLDDSPPPQIDRRWAIPLPIGFVAGAALAAAVLGLLDRRRRTEPAAPAT